MLAGRLRHGRPRPVNLRGGAHRGATQRGSPGDGDPGDGQRGASSPAGGFEAAGIGVLRHDRAGTTSGRPARAESDEARWEQRTAREGALHHLEWVVWRSEPAPWALKPPGSARNGPRSPPKRRTSLAKAPQASPSVLQGTRTRAGTARTGYCARSMRVLPSRPLPHPQGGGAGRSPESTNSNSWRAREGGNVQEGGRRRDGKSALGRGGAEGAEGRGLAVARAMAELSRPCRIGVVRTESPRRIVAWRRDRWRRSIAILGRTRGPYSRQCCCVPA